jgi:hypothetical protein
MDASLSRQFSFSAGNWSPEHSIVLATRPYPIDLKLNENERNVRQFSFQDKGTAFVEALAKRRSSLFGSLSIMNFIISDEDWTPISCENLERLFTLDVRFEKLRLPNDF